MKKILALVLVAVLILTCAVIPASANESDNSLIQPHYEVVCPGGAQHIMVAKGIAQFIQEPYTIRVHLYSVDLHGNALAAA